MSKGWCFFEAFSEQNHALVANKIALDIETLETMILRQTFGYPLAALHAELIKLDRELLQVVRVLEQLRQRFTNIGFHEVLCQRQRVQVDGTLDDWDCSFRFKIVLGYLEDAQAFVLRESYTNALTAVWTKVIIIDRQRLEHFVFDEQS